MSAVLAVRDIAHLSQLGSAISVPRSRGDLEEMQDFPRSGGHAVLVQPAVADNGADSFSHDSQHARVTS